MKKDSRLADLATDLLMAATSRRSLRRSLPLGEPAVPTQCLLQKLPFLANQGSACSCGAALSGPAWHRVCHRLLHAHVVCCCSLLTFLKEMLLPGPVLPSQAAKLCLLGSSGDPGCCVEHSLLLLQLCPFLFSP